ncbi:hypothetical protein ACPPVQ_18850 [Diaminobutyricibacter sp. McL0618]|uniref:hypothetical protein n=1 Tax=Leifsonia sp. McL0618 TaxID=3415677 RepID=UPI003CE991AB
MADELELLRNVDPESAGERKLAPMREEGVFDPEFDSAPVTPLVNGDREQKDWCGLILFGQLYALNRRRGRGATATERLTIAKAAGYTDNRAWSGWPNTWHDDEAGGRWIDNDGLGFLRHYYNEVRRTAPDDLPLLSNQEGS